MGPESKFQFLSFAWNSIFSHAAMNFFSFFTLYKIQKFKSPLLTLERKIYIPPKQN